MGITVATRRQAFNQAHDFHVLRRAIRRLVVAGLLDLAPAAVAQTARQAKPELQHAVRAHHRRAERVDKVIGIVRSVLPGLG